LILMESALKLNSNLLSDIRNIKIPDEKEFIIIEFEVMSGSNINELIEKFKLASIGINNKWKRVVMESHDVKNVLLDHLKQNYHRYYVEEFPSMDLLNFAVIFGRLQTVKLLVELGIKIETKDVNGYTPLMNACYKNHVDILKYLIKKNACIDHKDKSNFSALMHASYSGNTNVVKLLLAGGADVGQQNDIGETALILASQQNNLNVAWCLLEKNAEIDKADKRGFTPLMVASENNSAAVMKCLIDNNANLEVNVKNHVTALMIAAYHQNEAAIKVLLRNNAKLNEVQRATLSPESVSLVEQIQNELFNTKQNKYSLAEFRRFATFNGYQCHAEQSEALPSAPFSSDSEHLISAMTDCGRSIKV
jgi:ankyrin repeat protein